MVEEFDRYFDDVKLNFIKNENTNDKIVDVLAEQMALNEYICNDDRDNAIDLYKEIIDKYNSKN